MTAQTAVGFVIFASLMLMLLYFFLNHIFAIVLVSISALPALSLNTLCELRARPQVSIFPKHIHS